MTNSKETIKQNDQDKKVDKSTFIKETQQELAKVVWPSRQQLLSESVAVILMVILVASLIYLMDNIFSWSAGKVF
ncbi:MAG: preprotein translocase subunit SecE [Cyanobacterium sp. T60_A2020_053]|nr:preprotein translocase subunit SecE [Cyanobacterium sp. T60_A2020_053]